MCTGTLVQVTAAADVWALGVLAYETISQTVMTDATASHASRCANGAAAYPWEAPAVEQCKAWRESSLRLLLERCLNREAGARATAAELAEGAAQLSSFTGVEVA